MQTILNQIDNSNVFPAFAYWLKGQPSSDRSVSNEADIMTLPMRQHHFEIHAGDEHLETPSAMRDWTSWVRTMAPQAHLIAGARIITKDDGEFYSVPSITRFTQEQRGRYAYMTPYILLSTELTPKRPSTSALRKQDDMTVDEFGRKITPLIAEEELLRQICLLTAFWADRIWPGDGNEGSWSDRVWQSLRADQDPSRVAADLDPLEDIYDVFVEFALAYLRNSHFQRFAHLEGTMFHTQEFARICSGELAAEIMEHGDQLWGKG